MSAKKVMCGTRSFLVHPTAMDDLYQFTADAVNQNKGGEDAEKQRHQQEQDDIVLKAFNSFGFSKRWDSLLDTVKKQVIHESGRFELNQTFLLIAYFISKGRCYC